MKHIRLQGLAILALALAPLLANAAGGALEINQDCAAVGCFTGDSAGYPITINSPGSYVLTSDLLMTAAGATAIQINASPVEIDLNHHTIDGGGSCSGYPVTSCASGAGTLGISQGNGSQPAVFHLHDGTIKGFTHTPGQPIAIYLDQPGGAVLERLNVVENGGNAAIALSSTALGTVRLRDSQVSRNGSYGFGPLGAGSAGLTVIVENSDFIGNGLYGITSFSTGIYTGNRFSKNGGYAINGVSSTTALGQNAFSGNNGGGANAQYSITTVRDMGGNVCLDHTPCP